MKLMVTPKSLDNLKALEEVGVNEFIVYYDPLSVKNASAFDIKEIKEACEYCDYKDVKLYVGITKMLHNRDLAVLDIFMTDIKEVKLDGIIYSDLAVYMTAKDLGVKHPLYYDGDMLATNSYTTTLVSADKVFLSKELYYEEIEAMAKNIEGDVVIHAQGLIGMFHSLRPLVTNYKDYLDIDVDTTSESNYLYDEERDLYYPIYENEKGSFILGGKEICLIDQIDLLDEIGVTTLKIDGFMQSEKYLLNISKAYIEAINLYNNQDKSIYKTAKGELLKVVEEESSRPLDKGFFFKPTLYKVKK